MDVNHPISRQSPLVYSAIPGLGGFEFVHPTRGASANVKPRSGDQGEAVDVDVDSIDRVSGRKQSPGQVHQERPA